MDYSTPGFPVLYYLPEFAQTLVLILMTASNYLILCCSLLLLPSIFPSIIYWEIYYFSSELALHIKWPECWRFSFSISPSNEYSELISFRIDWFDLLAVQGTLKSLLQHHSSKASILWPSAFFMVQLSRLYVTTGEHIALTIWAFVDKVMSLIFNMLSRFVIAFLPRSKDLLIAWLQSLSTIILEPKKVKCHSFHFSPIYLQWSKGPVAMILVLWMLNFKLALSLSSFNLKRLFSSSSLSALRVVSSA